MARVDSGVGLAAEEDILRFLMPKSITTMPDYVGLLGNTLIRSRRNLADSFLAPVDVVGTPGAVDPSDVNLSSAGYLAPAIGEAANQTLVVVAKTLLDGSASGTRPGYIGWSNGLNIYIGGTNIIRASARHAPGGTPATVTASITGLGALSTWRMYIAVVRNLTDITLYNMTDGTVAPAQPMTAPRSLAAGPLNVGNAPGAVGALAQVAFACALPAALDANQRADLYAAVQARLAVRSTPITF